ncbi:MAG: alpha-L-fucosidase [Spirochaetales bacterium]|nr:alpha-L-fucosidase [Spirochaetales bacterium]
MKVKVIWAAVFLLPSVLMAQESETYQPSFESLEQIDPAPEWFKDANFGINFHWGLYSVPDFWIEWYPRNMYFSGSSENRHHIETYGSVTEWPYHNFILGAEDKQGRFVQFAPKLKSKGGQFDPEEWAQLFADSGAKFAGPVAEHHDGFSMWASKVNPWNAKEMGPKLDLVGLLTDAIRKRDRKIILSMHHAYNNTGFYQEAPKTDDPKLQMLYGQQGKEKNEALWLSKHKEIIDAYKPDIIWQDFNLPLISQPVLLEFLSYYYNQADAWGKEVVATYKDGLNMDCAVLDYERGGPADITENYWLTDDAISSTSWCYTEGLGYYSKKQILHGFLDRISKNGNLLLNISPKPDGSIPQEQKEILLAMGDWLKKYGEAVYATRAWEKYGEGPTKMGSGHGVFTEPAEGTAGDIRYTRSKDRATLYAILLGWEKGQREVVLHSLSTERIDLKNLESVELMNGAAGKYLPLEVEQNKEGLTVQLPERPKEELAYVLKLRFKGTIPALDKYVELDCAPYYYMVPEGNRGDRVLNRNLQVVQRKKVAENQWKFKRVGKGVYNILPREDASVALGYSASAKFIGLAMVNGEDDQCWTVEEALGGMVTISNKKYLGVQLLPDGNFMQVGPVGMGDVYWNLIQVCEMEQKPYKEHAIPGTIEAEDFDEGCPGEAFLDQDEVNEGGAYRQKGGLDIETCSTWCYNLCWTRAGEWLAYTVTVSKSATYKVSLTIATANEGPSLHIECDNTDLTGKIALPNTVGSQNWKVVEKTVKLDAGEHVLTVVIDGDSVNLDKMVFEEVD